MRVPRICVIDYGVGNLLSVQRALEHCGATVTTTADKAEILASDKIVFPGVGAFGNAMRELERRDLIHAIQEVAKRNIPLLGICLGMQLLLDESLEFGNHGGIGLIPGKVVPVPHELPAGRFLKIPHIGWNGLVPSNSGRGWEGSILDGITAGDPVYFVHSFMAAPSDEQDRLAHCVYGGHNVTAAIRRGSVTGCQFHPEKSGEIGLKILRNFISS
jgi:glutamine amidotransferase